MPTTHRPPHLAWYGGAPTAEAHAVLGTLTNLGFALREATGSGTWEEAHGVIVACPPATLVGALDPSFTALPPLQELSFRQPASRLLIWDPCGESVASVATDLGVTGVARPAGPPSATDPWQLNDYGLARWVHITHAYEGLK